MRIVDARCVLCWHTAPMLWHKSKIQTTWSATTTMSSRAMPDRLSSSQSMSIWPAIDQIQTVHHIARRLCDRSKLTSKNQSNWRGMQSEKQSQTWDRCPVDYYRWPYCQHRLHRSQWMWRPHRLACDVLYVRADKLVPEWFVAVSVAFRRAVTFPIELPRRWAICLVQYSVRPLCNHLNHMAAVPWNPPLAAVYYRMEMTSSLVTIVLRTVRYLKSENERTQKHKIIVLFE